MQVRLPQVTLVLLGGLTRRSSAILISTLSRVRLSCRTKLIVGVLLHVQSLNGPRQFLPPILPLIVQHMPGLTSNNADHLLTVWEFGRKPFVYQFGTEKHEGIWGTGNALLPPSWTSPRGFFITVPHLVRIQRKWIEVERVQISERKGLGIECTEKAHRRLVFIGLVFGSRVKNGVIEKNRS